MKFAVLDFETTGNQSADEIIQVGLAIIEEDRSISRVYGTYVNPGIPIPPFITSLTGITDSDVADAPELEDMMMELVPMLDDVVLVGHNVAFDFNFLQNALDRCGYLPYSGRILDTMHFLKICFPSLPSYQLGMVASHFGLEHDRPHQADSDALATAQVLLKCLEEIDDLPLLTIQRLSDLFADEDSDLAWFLTASVRSGSISRFRTWIRIPISGSSHLLWMTGRRSRQCGMKRNRIRSPVSALMNIWSRCAGVCGTFCHSTKPGKRRIS